MPGKDPNESDVHDAARAADALVPLPQSLDVVKAVFALAPIGMTLTRDGITLHCNPAYLRMFGYEGHESEIYGKPVTIMIAPEQRAAVDAQIDSRRRDVTSEAAYDTWGLRRDGTTFPFRVAVRKTLLGGERVTLAFFMDLTDSRQIEEELRRARDEFRAVIEACPVPAIMLDVQGRVQLWNPAAEHVFGWTREEAVGQLSPFVPEDRRAEYADNVSVGLSTGLRGRAARRRRKDGSEIDMEIYAAPMRDTAGNAVGMMALVVDVTERKRTDEALKRSEEQLRHAQKMDAVGQLAGGVAHDFNNVLTVISTLSDVLGQHVLDRVDAGLAAGLPKTPGAWDLPQCVAELRRAIDRASALTRQLLAFSRRQVLLPRSVDLSAIVRGMEPMLRTLAGPDLRIALELEPLLAATRADPGQMEQVIVNLALNARDAMASGGTIAIRTRNVDLAEELVDPRFPVPPGRYVAVSVSDAGVGMDDAIIARIFEPFFTTKDRGKGTGLGLSTVFGIVHQSGGHIRVESRVGHGSTFEVFMPRIAAEPNSGRTSDHDVPAIAPATVVLVEDDDDIRRLIRTVLERAAMTVHEARDPEHALALLAQAERSSLVLLTDVLMPGMSGPQLVERALELDPELPVVFMSGYADPASFPEHIRERAVGFLPKPFEARTLLRLLSDAVLARGRGRSSGR